MKFACNSDYLFQNANMAFLQSYLPMIVDLNIECTNILVVCCLQDPLDLIGTFVSLVIISQFDEFVLNSL
jgi:hypothetical protein